VSGLDALAFLVGGTWVSEPTSGAARTLEETCAWSPEGDLILTEVVVRSPDGAVRKVRGRFGWHLGGLYMANETEDGTRTAGHQIEGAPGAWTFEVNGASERRRITLARRGEDALVISQEAFRAGRFRPLGSRIYRRRSTGSTA